MAGKKKRVNRTLQIKESDLRRVIKEALAEQNYMTQLAYLAALRDVESFGTTRLSRVVVKANKFMEEVDEGRITAKDLQEMLGEETRVFLEGVKT